jgi:hypothetical protein
LIENGHQCSIVGFWSLADRSGALAGQCEEQRTTGSTTVAPPLSGVGPPNGQGPVPKIEREKQRFLTAARLSAS